MAYEAMSRRMFKYAMVSFYDSSYLEDSRS